MQVPAAIYITEAICAGDTWPGIPAISIRPNNAIPVIPAASANMVFFKAGEKPGSKAPGAGCEIKSPDGITLTSAANWEFVIPPQILPLDAGEWNFRFKTTNTSGHVRTWFTGTLTLF